MYIVLHALSILKCIGIIATNRYQSIEGIQNCVRARTTCSNTDLPGIYGFHGKFIILNAIKLKT